MGRHSFTQQVESAIRTKKKRSTSISNNLLTGCYAIIRKTKSYRFQDFMSNNFLTAHYFLLVELINEEHRIEKKAMKKAQRRNK